MKRMKIFAALLALTMAAVSLFSCGKAEKKYVTLPEDFGSEEYAIGFRPGDVALAKEVQRILDEMCADGTADTISQKWFSTNLIVNDRDYPRDEEVSADDTSLEDLKSRGKFILGLDDSFPPMGFRSENGMDVVGFDIDVAKKVCEKMGVTLVTQPISWDAKDSELSSGKIDCIWNGFTSLPEREEAMTLSFPYMVNKQVVVVLKDSPIKTLADLKDKTVVLQKGSSALDALEAKPELKASLKGEGPIQVANNVLALNDLGKGANGGDAVIMDEVVAKYYTSHRDQLVKDTASKAE